MASESVAGAGRGRALGPALEEGDGAVMAFAVGDESALAVCVCVCVKEREWGLGE